MKTTGILHLIEHDHRHSARSTTDRCGTGLSRRPAATLLVTDRHDPRRLTVRRNGPWTRLAVRMQATRLDQLLADGRSPESGRLLAARAHQLTSPSARHDLAQDWAQLLETHRGPLMRNPRVPLDRQRIRRCEPQIRRLIHALLTPLPTPARGAAMATHLLGDGSGPLHHPHRADDLQAALNAAIANLHPALPLTASS
jgi:hypothetical protein